VKNNFIENALPPAKYKIVLEPKHFERSYSIYVLELAHKIDKFYFIEHLSDTLSISNKLPFKRLSQHLEDIASSKNNQLYLFLLTLAKTEKYKDSSKITEQQKWKVDEFLTECTISMHVYPLIRYHFERITKNDHKENLIEVKKFESQVKLRFIKSGKNLLNEDEKQIGYMRYEDIKFPKIWEDIRLEFNL